MAVDELLKSVKDQFKAFNILNVNRKNQKLKLSNSGEVAWFSEIVDWEFLVEGKKQIIKAFGSNPQCFFLFHLNEEPALKCILKKKKLLLK